HAHNNQQLAYANTIEALIMGASRLDGTMNGIGRGAGNCPMELLIGFLKNPKFRLRPVLTCIRDA
ncbi:MAG: nucleoid-structuring protein H-NS, partial [Pseudomonas stutzeri]|nr:nucleoid-structuring protein H-NS [Xanthomonadales bacterium]NIN83089.1 nucleoid-structuring protein H-NS [Stutzerimonas stutzeri]NIQ24959.1 nucleoid-structuring protein H-NS [Stutzerimonas stutzeri]NIS59099.1 nucleoid-structuring protein H-NS [Stutzerimonas stutzeri]